MKILAVGQEDNSGIGVAFRRHVEALRASGDFDVQVNGGGLASIGYVHGGPTMVSRAVRQPRQIGYLVCESTELPRSYQLAFNNVDEIWTCSSFCRNIISAHTAKQVKVVPHYTTHFETTINEDCRPTFLVAFNGHSRILRKLPSLALAAIKSVSSDAHVIVKSLNLQQNMLSWLGNEAAGLDLELINHELSDEELANLYRRVDIVVSLHAAEGFGLHLLEAMAFGKCVVATKFGGNTDFMHIDNSFLVDFKMVKSTDDYFKGYWALPSLQSAQDAIAAAVETYRDDTLSQYISNSVKNFDFDNTVAATKKAL
jgi:glycosyltransferase involved in cell wall biosynthesis